MQTRQRKEQVEKLLDILKEKSVINDNDIKSMQGLT